MSSSRIATAVTAVVSAAVVAGAAPSAAAAPGAAPVRVSTTAAMSGAVLRAYDGQHVVLHRDETVTLQLRACESCGYRWVLARRPDPSVVSFEGRSSTSTACAGCVGGNADEDFRFVAVSLGQTQASFSYVGPRGAVAKRRTVTLAVLRRARSQASSAVHVVRAGDTLYRVARAALGRDATPPRVRELAARLYRDNRAVIGRDPDFLLPGEVLLVDLTRLRLCGTTAQPTTCTS